MIEHFRVSIKDVLAGRDSINDALQAREKSSTAVISIIAVGEEFVVFYSSDY